MPWKSSSTRSSTLPICVEGAGAERRSEGRSEASAARRTPAGGGNGSTRQICSLSFHSPGKCRSSAPPRRARRPPAGPSTGGARGAAGTPRSPSSSGRCGRTQARGKQSAVRSVAGAAPAAQPASSLLSSSSARGHTDLRVSSAHCTPLRSPRKSWGWREPPGRCTMMFSAARGDEGRGREWMSGAGHMQRAVGGRRAQGWRPTAGDHQARPRAKSRPGAHPA